RVAPHAPRESRVARPRARPRARLAARRTLHRASPTPLRNTARGTSPPRAPLRFTAGAAESTPPIAGAASESDPEIKNGRGRQSLGGRTRGSSNTLSQLHTLRCRAALE